MATAIVVGGEVRKFISLFINRERLGKSCILTRPIIPADTCHAETQSDVTTLLNIFILYEFKKRLVSKEYSIPTVYMNTQLSTWTMLTIDAQLLQVRKNFHQTRVQMGGHKGGRSQHMPHALPNLTLCKNSRTHCHTNQ